jgi:hypothetical protein
MIARAQRPGEGRAAARALIRAAGALPVAALVIAAPMKAAAGTGIDIVRISQKAAGDGTPPAAEASSAMPISIASPKVYPWARGMPCPDAQGVG